MTYKVTYENFSPLRVWAESKREAAKECKEYLESRGWKVKGKPKIEQLEGEDL